MAWVKKKLGLDKPTNNAEQVLFTAVEESKDRLRERLERLERYEQVKARQDIKRRIFD